VCVFLKPVALPPGDTHTRTPNFRSFCALPFAAFRRIDFAGVCLSGVCSFKRRECVDSQPLSVLFVVCVCSYFLPKGGIKNSPFMPHFLTHINTYLYARTKMAPTTQQKILAAYNGLYGTTFALSVLRLVLSRLLRGGPFFITSFFPESKFCHHRLTELLFPINSLSLSNGVIIYNTTTGVTLYHNWVKYYGPKGIAPYFLKTEGAVAMVCLFVFFSVN